MTAEQFDSRALRDVLGRFGTGVTVVTARTPDGQHVGMTMSSFNSVSLDPPLVLFSIAKTATGFAEFRESESFVINVLSVGQKELAANFGRSRGDKWAGVECVESEAGARYVLGSLAYLECRPYAVYPGGDHEIFVVEVTAIDKGPGSEPLIFYKGHLRGLGVEYTDMPDWHLAYYYSR